MVSSHAEHPATLDAIEWLRGQGAAVDLVAVDEDARAVLGEGRGPTLVEALEGRRDVAVLSLLWANNEVGTIEDTDAIADLCASRPCATKEQPDGGPPEPDVA